MLIIKLARLPTQFSLVCMYVWWGDIETRGALNPDTSELLDYKLARLPTRFNHPAELFACQYNNLQPLL